ncbi:MAG TPA: hypothetical protein VG755_15145 [Nannocystaceae bacterium]|nr:hypothetical protein [Nannocystaceae bacterium]
MASLWGWFVVAASLGSPRVDVVWSGPESCPRDRFVDALAHHLASSDAAPVEVAAEVVEDGGAWRLSATLSARGQTYAPRSFAGRSCEAVVDAAALATAIAIDPLHVDDAPEVALPEPEPATPPIAAPVVPDAVAPPVAPSRTIAVRTPTRVAPPRVRGFLALAGTIDGGALPGVGGGLVASGGVIRRKLRIELSAGWRAPVRVRSLDDRDVGARVQLVTAGARVCRTITPTRALELPLCAGVDAGVLRGRGFGLAPNRTAYLPWIAPIAAVGVSWSATDRLALFARSELGVPLLHRELAIRGLSAIDRVAPVFGRGVAGVEVRLP